jgi:hypothetical protein
MSAASSKLLGSRSVLPRYARTARPDHMPGAQLRPFRHRRYCLRSNLVSQLTTLETQSGFTDQRFGMVCRTVYLVIATPDACGDAPVIFVSTSYAQGSFGKASFCVMQPIPLETAIFLPPPIGGLLTDRSTGTPRRSSALAQHDLDFTQLADDLFRFEFIARHSPSFSRPYPDGTARHNC